MKASKFKKLVQEFEWGVAKAHEAWLNGLGDLAERDAKVNKLRAKLYKAGTKTKKGTKP